MPDLDVDRHSNRYFCDLADTTATGDLIRYTCPAGKTAIFNGGVFKQTAAATIVLRYSGAINFDLDSFTVTTVKIHKGFDFPITLTAGRSIAYVVTAGVAGVANGELFIEEHSLGTAL
jgi:hypothetical protein